MVMQAIPYSLGPATFPIPISIISSFSFLTTNMLSLSRFFWEAHRYWCRAWKRKKKQKQYHSSISAHHKENDSGMSGSKLRALPLVSAHPHGDSVEAVVTIPISVIQGTHWSAVVLNLPTLPLSFHVTESRAVSPQRSLVLTRHGLHQIASIPLLPGHCLCWAF